MADKPHLIARVREAQKFFNKATELLREEDSTFRPSDDAFTVAAHVVHTAQSIDWFVDGALLGKEWTFDFTKADAAARAVPSLTTARATLDNSFANAVAAIEAASDATLDEHISADDPVFADQPRSDVVFGITEHTAHHRGALATYTRLLGRVAPIPYAS